MQTYLNTVRDISPTFSGRASRQACWIFTLVNMLVSLILWGPNPGSVNVSDIGA